mgnify:CR=1 FL=1
MPLNVTLTAVQRGNAGIRLPLQVDERNALRVVEDLPSLVALVNRGVVWSAGEAAGVASVIAPPTTLAQISLYNNEDEDGLSYLVLRAFGVVTATPAGLSQFGISHCIHRAKPATLPDQDIAPASITNMKAGGSRQATTYVGAARIDLALAVADDLWKPLGYSILNAVTGVGWQLDIWLDSLVIIPPGGLYSLASVASSTTVNTRLGMTWAEVQLN